MKLIEILFHQQVQELIREAYAAGITFGWNLRREADRDQSAILAELYEALKALVEYHKRTKSAIPCLADAITALAKVEVNKILADKILDDYKEGR